VYSIFKKILVLATLSLAIVFTVHAFEVDYLESDIQFDNYQFIEDAKLASSRYTRPDDLSLVDSEFYVPITSADELVLENDNFQLYYDEDIVSFKILNKSTGYVWSTAIEDPDAGTYDGLLESGIGIEYILPEKDMFIEENIGIASTVFSAETSIFEDTMSISLNFGGYCSTRACTRLYPLYLEGQYTLEEMIDLGFTEINIGFDLNVTLTDQGIVAYVPFDSITEAKPEEIVLSSIILFPGLGATRMDEIPGYMVIPDGAGALIRYEDNGGQFKTPMEERFFGINYGLQELQSSVTNYPLSMPIFGAVHGVNQNAFIGIIEQGEYNSRLLAYPNGAHNLDYNLIFPKFDFKQVYRQSFLSDGSGGAMKYLETSFSDLEVKYDFLEGVDANYVGIAEDYRDYLKANDVLHDQDQSGDINLYTEYLMSDNENSFFGNLLVKMSSVDDVASMYNYFLSEGIEDMSVGLIGWNNGGYSGHYPAKVDFENSLGSNASYRDLIDLINEKNSVLLVNNYVFATNDSSRISYRLDVAKGSNRFKMEFTCDQCVHTDNYVLYPSVSRSLAEHDYQDYLDENVQVLFESIASTLFSYYDSGYYNRSDTYAEYLEVLKLYDGMASYLYPFSYAFAYTDGFYSAPLYNSQLKYFDDVVPLLPVVLKGSIDMYAYFLNYNSLGKETILNLIDYGINPSYILSMEASSNLKETDLREFYTTEFDLWKETVVTEYNYINDALKYVNGEFITDRVVIDFGLVKVTYSNGIDIYVNYTSQDALVGEIIIKAMDYYVGGVSE